MHCTSAHCLELGSTIPVITFSFTSSPSGVTIDVGSDVGAFPPNGAANKAEIGYLCRLEMSTKANRKLIPAPGYSSDLNSDTQCDTYSSLTGSNRFVSLGGRPIILLGR